MNRLIGVMAAQEISLPPHGVLYRVNADGSGLSVLFADADMAAWGPAWSPDGAHIAVTLIPNGSSAGELYLLNADGTSRTAITHNGRNNYSPEWSLDGEWMAYISQDGTNTRSAEIYIARPDGSEETRLTQNDRQEYGISWNGGQFIFGGAGDSGWYLHSGQCYVAPGECIADAVQLDIPGNAPSSSPDSLQLAFVTDRDGDDEIFLLNGRNGDQTNITNNTHWDDQPQWSPDGSKIAFVSDRDGAASLYVYDVFEHTTIHLTPNMGREVGFPSWSPDSTQLIFHAGTVGTPAAFNSGVFIGGVVFAVLIGLLLAVIVYRRSQRSA
jgi:Tol biopolymer transport system component